MKRKGVRAVILYTNMPLFPPHASTACLSVSMHAARVRVTILDVKKSTAGGSKLDCWQLPHVYPIYWPPSWRTKEVLQHGGSMLGSVILCGTFRRISQLWDNAHTLNLENCLLHLLSTISQFFDFVRCILFDFIFYCVTAHTLYAAVPLFCVRDH